MRNKCYSQQESAYNFNYLKWKLPWEFSVEIHKMEIILGKYPNREQYMWNNPLKAMGDAWKKCPDRPQVKAIPRVCFQPSLCWTVWRKNQGKAFNSLNYCSSPVKIFSQPWAISQDVRREVRATHWDFRPIVMSTRTDAQTMNFRKQDWTKSLLGWKQRNLYKHTSYSFCFLH